MIFGEESELLLSDAEISGETILLLEKNNQLGAGMYDPRDGGIGYLRQMMEGIKPEEIPNQKLSWLIEKYQLLCDSINTGLFSKKMSSDTHGIHLLVRYSLFIEDILTANNIDFIVLGGITPEGWVNYQKMNN
jgi:hypothetical protein